MSYYHCKNYIERLKEIVLYELPSWPKDKEHCRFLSVGSRENTNPDYRDTLQFTEYLVNDRFWAAVFTKEEFEEAKELKATGAYKKTYFHDPNDIEHLRNEVLRNMSVWPKDKAHCRYLSIASKYNKNPDYQDQWQFTETLVNDYFWVGVFNREEFEMVKDPLKVTKILWDREGSGIP